MFWTDWGSKPRIETAGMDGYSRNVIIADNLIWPNGLSVEHDEKLLYWVDGGTKKIEYSRFDGHGRRELIGEFVSFSIQFLNLENL